MDLLQYIVSGTSALTVGGGVLALLALLGGAWLLGRRWGRELEARERTHAATDRLRQYEADYSRMMARSERERLLAAQYDALTGLPNRNLLHRRFAELLAVAERDSRQFAVMFLDVDRFKMINDTRGHSFGDLVLKQVAAVLRRTMIGNFHVFRYGGDEFVVLTDSIDSIEQLAAASRRLVGAFSEPIAVDRQEVYLTASVGVSVYPKHGRDFDSLLKHADAAMYSAKEKGKNNFQFYSESINEAIRRKVELENELRKALEREEFELHYQPQVNADTGRLIGVEALLRWNNPRLGPISPAEFVPVAEDTGLIVPIGNWVLRTACLQNKAWQDAGHPPVPVSVNLSMKQFEQTNFVGSVYQTLMETKLEPKHLCLEITETVAHHNIERTIRRIQDLKFIGVKIAIDDFGTGYSSLSYLKKFAVDTLKIDKSFVKDIAGDGNDLAIVTTIISMSNILQFKVIAEGVETKEQLALLREKGCSEVQGYYYGKPTPAERFEADYLAEREAPTERELQLAEAGGGAAREMRP